MAPRTMTIRGTFEQRNASGAASRLNCHWIVPLQNPIQTGGWIVREYPQSAGRWSLGAE
jgi:hypothetical protein